MYVTYGLNPKAQGFARIIRRAVLLEMNGACFSVSVV